MSRYDLSTRSGTHEDQENNKSKDAKTEQVVEYIEHLNKLIQSYPPHLILQMDETPTNVDMPDNKTIEVKGRQSWYQSIGCVIKLDVEIGNDEICLNGDICSNDDNILTLLYNLLLIV